MQTSTDSAAIDSAENPDAVKAALTAERTAAKAAKAEAGEARAAADAANAQVAAMTEERDAAVARARAAEREVAVFVAASEHGIPADHVHRLNGNTLAELREDAHKLRLFLGDLQPAEPHDPLVGLIARARG